MNRGPETVNHKAKLVETRSVGADFQCNVDGEVGDGAGAVAVAYGPTARRGAEPSSLILGTLWVVSPVMGSTASPSHQQEHAVVLTLFAPHAKHHPVPTVRFVSYNKQSHAALLLAVPGRGATPLCMNHTDLLPYTGAVPELGWFL